MREIEVETFLKAMGTGVSRPVLVVGDDCEEYILKNETVDQDGNMVSFDCMFVNELLAYQIGCYLDVPMPEAVVAFVDNKFAEDDPVVRFAYRFEKGKYFATRKLEKVENNIMKNYEELIKMKKPYILKSWNKFFKEVNNKEDIAKILAFDILIANFDRYNNDGNILVDNTVVKKMYAIDHGHAFFGPTWNQGKINCLKLQEITPDYIKWYTDGIISIMRKSGACGSGKIFGALQENIDLENLKNHSFNEVVLKIRSISNDMILKWCNSIPDEWYINKNLQTAYYSNFIMKQKSAVEHIIQNLAINNAFVNYRGGILEYGTIEKENHI